MISRTRPFALVPVVLLLLVGAHLSAQNRVDAREALTHVTKRIDPTVPKEAAEAKVGGKVYADVIIRADGTVESVEILAGADMLKSTTSAAIKQWTFRPFLEGGKPARVIALIEIDFPDPVKDEERRIYDGYRTSEYQCRRQLESSPESAIKPCEDAVAFALQLPAERKLERSQTITLLGQAFVTSRRFADALLQFERALSIRRESGGLNDEGVAALFELIGITHFAAGDWDKADRSMAASVNSYEGAIAALPNFGPRYTPRLQATLRRYSNMKRSVGDTAGADALIRKADALTVPAAPAPPVEDVRKLDGVTLLGPTGSRLAEEDLRKIRALMPKGAPSVWLIIGQRLGMYGPLSWDIQVYLQPDFTSPELRIGRLITLTSRLAAPDAFSASKTWEQKVVTGRYGQVVLPGRTMGDVQSETDRNRPFEIVEFSNAPFTNDEILRLVKFVRDRAVDTRSNTDPPRTATDIQPWAIQILMRWSPTEAEPVLINPSTRGSQTMRLRFTAEGISILEMR
jgi:hypothetical protein